jgi:hypothetical protein
MKHIGYKKAFVLVEDAKCDDIEVKVEASN